MAFSFDEDCILHFAVRYALGRTTAAPSIVVRILERDWARLRAGTCEAIQLEIRDAIVSARAGHVCDVAEWSKVLIWDSGPPSPPCSHSSTRLEHSASGNESQLICTTCGKAVTPME